MDAPQLEPEWLSNAKLLIASLLGGVVHLYFKFRREEHESRTQAAVHSIWLLFGCVTCGFYATPAVVAWVRLNPEYRDGMAAIIGLVGMTFAKRLLQAAEGLNLKELIVKWATKGAGK